MPRRRSNQKRKFLGLCLDCNRFAEPGKLRCAYHLQEQNQRAKKRYHDVARLRQKYMHT
ncbi:MAG: hypothetical protein ACXACY_14785 [Candidatus Hodarchaeales archaeon]|jgi:hypothetical protein